MSVRLFGVAALSMVLFVVLGFWVTHQALSRIDVEGAALRGGDASLAVIFTNSGYGIALTCLGVVSIVAALVFRFSLKIPIAIVLSQLVSQGIVNAIKGVYARPRPDAWIHHREPGFSYPSGHATTAIVFYGAWLVVLWLSPLPVGARLAGAGALLIWMLGIGWSRLALGAHYPTDVLGGFLFGTAWLCATIGLALLLDAGLGARRG